MAEYDLEALWDEHCRCEFETRDVDAAMATMVEEPYVNHIPTMTGDGKLAHEHIYWDQASVLVQVGLLDPGGRLPATGVAQARKAADKSLASNELMPNWKKSEGKPL